MKQPSVACGALIDRLPAIERSLVSAACIPHSVETGTMNVYDRAAQTGPKAFFEVISPVASPKQRRRTLARACGELGRVRK